MEFYFYLCKNKGPEMDKVINFMRTEALTLIGVAVGALGGFLYWRFVGCIGGGCPITSSPLFSSVWGALIGGLLLNMFKKKKK